MSQVTSTPSWLNRRAGWTEELASTQGQGRTSDMADKRGEEERKGLVVQGDQEVRAIGAKGDEERKTDTNKTDQEIRLRTDARGQASKQGAKFFG